MRADEHGLAREIRKRTSAEIQPNDASARRRPEDFAEGEREQHRDYAISRDPLG